MKRTFHYSALIALVTSMTILPAYALQANIGEVSFSARNTCPTNTHATDGSILLISENTILFSVIGVNFGGDGRSSFALPDLRGRVAMGDNSYYPVATRHGVENVALYASNLPAHRHDINYSEGPLTSASPLGAYLATFPAGVDAYSATSTPDSTILSSDTIGYNVPSSVEFNNVAPSLALTSCIRLTSQ